MEQRYILDEDGNQLRRVKISRGVATTKDILRVDVWRLDDDGLEFRTSMSIDGEIFALAKAVHGSAGAALDWLRETAEEAWEEDRLARVYADDVGEQYKAPLSISREVQRVLFEAATAHLHGLRLRTGTPPPPGGRTKATRRTAAQRTAAFAGYQTAFKAAHAAAYQGAYQQGQTAGRQAGRQDGRDDGFRAGLAAAAAVIRGDLVEADGDIVRVIAGEYDGMTLADLADADVILVVEILLDAERRGLWTDHGLIRAWLDRHHPRWREAAAQSPEEAATEMETSRAWRLLGLPPGSDRSAVTSAQKRLLRRVHPDVGGTDELAIIINAAADHLLSLLPEIDQ